MKKMVIMGLLLMLLVGCGSKVSSVSVTGEEAYDLVKEEGAVLIDVRTEEEYLEYNIEGAVNIPLDSLEMVSNTYDKETKIVVYCRSGARSGRAASLLLDMGYTFVYDLGSIDNWKEQ